MPKIGGKTAWSTSRPWSRDVIDIVPDCRNRLDWLFCHDSDVLLLNAFNFGCLIRSNRTLCFLDFPVNSFPGKNATLTLLLALFFEKISFLYMFALIITFFWPAIFDTSAKFIVSGAATSTAMSNSFNSTCISLSQFIASTVVLFALTLRSLDTSVSAIITCQCVIVSLSYIIRHMTPTNWFGLGRIACYQVFL